MFTLAFERRHRILLVRASGVLNSTDIGQLDDAVLRFTAHHGLAHGLIDFSAVSTLAVPIGRLVRRGGLSAFAAGYKQVLVVAHAELFALARNAARELLVVSSIGDALKYFGVTNPSFEPVAFD